MSISAKAVDSPPSTASACSRAFSIPVNSKTTESSPANAEDRMRQIFTWIPTEKNLSLPWPGGAFDDVTAVAAFGCAWDNVVRCLPGEVWKSSQQPKGQFERRRSPAYSKETAAYAQRRLPVALFFRTVPHLLNPCGQTSYRCHGSFFMVKVQQRDMGPPCSASRS